jgi:hypothetical protein
MFHKYPNLCCIAVDSNKRAILPWKQYQTKRPTEDELNHQFANHKCKGIAIICGAISNNLEVIDIDAKYSLSENLFKDYCEMLPDSLLSKLYIVATKNKGYHIYYQCEVINGNAKLAQRLTTEAERKENPHEKVKVLIETRGEAGYVVAPPTEGYSIIQGEDIPIVSIDEREMMLDAARSFNEIIDEVKPQHVASKGFSISPFEDYNNRGDVVGLLESHGWKVVKQDAKKVTFLRPGVTDSKSSGDYNYSLNWFSVFTTSTEFEVNKAYKPSAVYCLLECDNNWKECARKLTEASYGEKVKQVPDVVKHQVFKMIEQGEQKDDIVFFVKNKTNTSIAESTSVVDNLITIKENQICTFWEVTEKGKFIIIRTKMLSFLRDNGGFFLYYYDKQSSIYKIIRIVDGLVEEATLEQMKKFIKDYINNLPDSFDGIASEDNPKEQLQEVVHKGHSTYFSISLIEFMDHAKLNLLKDTRDAAYFPFSNGIVKVTKGKKEIIKYGDFHVWKSQVVDFKIDIDEAIDYESVEFYKFIQCFCNNDSERMIYTIQILGYLLHGFKDSTRPYAIILAEETDNEKEGGGTGKGIFYKAVSKILNTVFIDGKNFKLDKTFAFQRVDLSTQLVIIEDCRKNIDFEGFYSNITEGVTVEKKNKDELYIPYVDAPKFGFTTNYSIALNGNHAKRRAKIVEFSNFFSPSRTPFDYFGHSLFNEWDKDEWNRFYNMLLESVQIYLQQGISESYQSETLKTKQIKINFGEDFLFHMQNMNKGQWVEFGLEYDNFLKVNDIEKRDYSKRKFKAGIVQFADIFNMKLEERRNRENMNKSEIKCT